MPRIKIECADCLDVLRGMKDNSVTAIVTDPPVEDLGQLLFSEIFGEMTRVALSWVTLLPPMQWCDGLPMRGVDFSSCFGQVVYQYPVFGNGYAGIANFVEYNIGGTHRYKPYLAVLPEPINIPVPEPYENPGTKPVELMTHIIKHLCLQSIPSHAIPSVMDPFMGSGATGIAAYDLGFDFHGVELHAGYCTQAQESIADHAGIDLRNLKHAT